MKVQSDLRMAGEDAGASARPRPPREVLHLVGRVSEAVFSFLGPATAALAEKGARQTVVLLDDPAQRHLLPKFHESVRLVLASAQGSTADRLQALTLSYRTAAQATGPGVAAHLHGVVCFLIGVYAARRHGLAMPTHFSPHGSRLLGSSRALGLALHWLLRPLSGRSRQRLIVNSNAEARTMFARVRRNVDVIESPVDESLFGESALPAELPRIVTSSRALNPLGAAQYAQCAVLLADQVVGLRLAWIGAGDAESIARLDASGVQRQPIDDDPTRLADMLSSWIYVAPAGTPGFPVALAEAMALGLPCVAWDTPYHRDLIEDGVSGFLCVDVFAIVERLLELLASEPLRERLGGAGRNVARARFDGRHFRAALLGAYETPVAPSIRPTQPTPADRVHAALPPASTSHDHPTTAPLITRRQIDRQLQVRPMLPGDVAMLQARIRHGTAEELQRMLAAQRAGHATLLIACVADEPLGFASIRWAGAARDAFRERFAECPEIHSVEVDAHVRSFGIGSKLVAVCERLALERGFVDACVDLAPDNVHAYALYLRLGYVEAARTRAASRRSGENGSADGGDTSRRLLVKRLASAQ